MPRLFKDVTILDTTFRDGTQGFAESTNLEAAIKAVGMIDRLAFPEMFLETGFANSTRGFDLKRIKRSIEVCRYSQVAAFCRSNKDDIAQVMELCPPAVTLVGKSRPQDAAKLKDCLEPNDQLSIIKKNVSRLGNIVFNKESGDRSTVIFDAEHFFTAYLGGSKSRKYAQEVLRAALAGGARWVVLCDTTGEVDPVDVKETIEDLIRCGFEAGKLGVHFHNCRGYALANTEMAFSLGVRHIQGVFGEKIGDNGGNLNLITFILNLYYQNRKKKQILRKSAMRTLTPLYHSVCAALGMDPDPGAPYVGLMIVRAGMHASGIRKSGIRNYLHFDPQDVGNELVTGLDDIGGGSNIEKWANNLGVDIPKDQKQSVIGHFRREIERGKAYRTHAVDASAGFHAELLQSLGWIKCPFEVTFFRTMTEMKANYEPLSEAHLSTTPGSEEKTFRQVGKGEVNASENILREAWYRYCKKNSKRRQKLKSIKFLNYDHRVLVSSEGSGASVRVFCTFTDGRRVWTSVGVHKAQIMASWEALYYGYLYGMLVNGRCRRS